MKFKEREGETDKMQLVFDEKSGKWNQKKEPAAVIECETADDFEFVKAAVERATAKKPDIEGDGYDDKGELIYDTWICPNCGTHYEIEYDTHKYCPECGQKIDRTDIEL